MGVLPTWLTQPPAAPWRADYLTEHGVLLRQVLRSDTPAESLEGVRAEWQKIRWRCSPDTNIVVRIIVESHVLEHSDVVAAFEQLHQQRWEPAQFGLSAITRTDLAGWLREAILACKVIAERAACDAGEGGWYTMDDLTDYDYVDLGDSAAAYIAANPPHEAVARCESDLAILDAHAHVKRPVPGPNNRVVRITVCAVCGNRYGVPCSTVLNVAAGYRQVPGYAEATAEAGN
ncbi:DUF6221 family protein [Sphaerisporangium aureirubrum]|uniref:DUF6221 family protein n=1 Tax=Sphaerisporangium aureirubrum TaxID=1544736 RepID=A0ABW1NEK1_9ACTN